VVHIFCGFRANEVLGSFLVPHVQLNPFVPAQVICDPGLAALAFAPDPIAECLTAIGVTLFLDSLVVHDVPPVLVETGASV
jgi:hypothetical protein